MTEIARPNRRAAPLNVPSSTTARKMRSWSMLGWPTSIRQSLIFNETEHSYQKYWDFRKGEKAPEQRCT
jgi:hypothetical protein